MHSRKRKQTYDTYSRIGSVRRAPVEIGPPRGATDTSASSAATARAARREVRAVGGGRVAPNGRRFPGPGSAVQTSERPDSRLVKEA